MSDDFTERAVREFAELVGVRLNDLYRPAYSWNGRSIATRERGSKTRWSDVVHDIAHWGVCSPRRRRLSDFGLGPGPDSQKSVKRVVSSVAAQNEEELASCLGILLEELLGMNWQSTAVEHSWDTYGTDPVGVVAELERRFPDLDGSDFLAWCKS